MSDVINYVLFTNPVSSSAIDFTKYVFQKGGSAVQYSGTPTPPAAPPVPAELLRLPVQRVIFSGSMYSRLAGISGAAAVLLGAYGSHSLLIKPGLEERKKIFETANRYHFFHTLALLGVPLSRRPKTAAVLLTLGMTIFCGTCYYDAFSGDTRLRKFTPIGGTLLVAGWIAFIV